jgi:myo-inositol-1(or 4)-monophosphatase
MNMSAISSSTLPHPVTTDEGLDVRESALVALIREAGAVAQAAFSVEGQFEMKGPQDFLTVTDAAVEKLLREKLTGLFPEDGFLGEETGAVAGDAIWVVDPIDGTANFARRIPHYCISVALVARGKMLLGAIYDPAHDELYLARAGRGATRNGKSISVAATTDPASACVELGWSTRVGNTAYLDVLAKTLDAGANVRRAATGALGLAYVADGRSDGYAELHMYPWDCLAGLLLVREAGGVVCDFLGAGGLEHGGAVLAAAPGVAGMMIAASGIEGAE